MIGSGRTSIAAAADLSRACVQDLKGIGATAPAAVQALASLGTWGNNCQNQERDLHKWVKNLFNLKMETFEVPFMMEAWCFSFHSIIENKHCFYFW